MAERQNVPLTAFFTASAYCVGLLFIILPFIDVLTQAWPFQLGAPSWRYGTIGLGANVAISPTFGLLLVSVVAAVREHRRTLLTCALVAGLGALLVFGLTVIFSLDVIQLRAGIPRDNPRGLWMFEVGAAKAASKYIVTVPVLVILALASWRHRKAIIAATPSDDEAPVLVRQQAQ